MFRHVCINIKTQSRVMWLVVQLQLKIITCRLIKQELWRYGFGLKKVLIAFFINKWMMLDTIYIKYFVTNCEYRSTSANSLSWKQREVSDISAAENSNELIWSTCSNCSNSVKNRMNIISIHYESNNPGKQIRVNIRDISLFRIGVRADKVCNAVDVLNKSSDEDITNVFFIWVEAC